MSEHTHSLEQDLAEAVEEKRRLETKVKVLVALIDDLTVETLARWRQQGISQMRVLTVNGPRTLYSSSQVWARSDPLTGLDLEALRDQFPGLDTVNWSKAAGLLRELIAQGDKEALAQLAAAGVLADERTRINVRKS